MYVLPQSVNIGFNIEDLPNLRGRIYRIIWAAISFGHIRDQYFSDRVINATNAIKRKKPTEFKDFMCIINGTGLSEYGRTSRHGRGLYRYSCPKIDRRWWRQVWNLIAYGGDIELKQIKE